MKFEVNKFLTLTALLAGAATAAVACSSSSDGNPVDAGGGKGGSPAAGSGGKGSGGKGSAGENVGGASQGGAIENGAGAPGSQAGAPEGGAAEGGAPGTNTPECISDLVGEGGAAAEGTTPCDVWSAVGEPDCGNEFGNFATQLCGNLLYEVRPAVLAVFNACASGVGDVCDQAGVQACADGLIGAGCTQDNTAAACAAIAANCDPVDSCVGLLNLMTADAQTAAVDCMDPNSTAYDATFTGACKERLLACVHFSL